MQTEHMCPKDIRQRVTLVRVLAESELPLLDYLFIAFEVLSMNSVKYLLLQNAKFPVLL